MRRDKGYALFVVLALMALLFVLTTSISLNVKIETSQGLRLLAEQEALNGADSGVQYALESVRENKPLPISFASASWNSLQVQGGWNACFKVYENSSPPCPSGERCMMGYGEVVRGACGDYPNNLEQVVSARTVEGIVDPVKGVLVGWEEVLP